jgi:hypothetical protein
VYRTETAPLLDYYRGRNILVTVDADQAVDRVTEAILGALAPILGALAPILDPRTVPDHPPG